MINEIFYSLTKEEERVKKQIFFNAHCDAFIESSEF